MMEYLGLKKGELGGRDLITIKKLTVSDLEILNIEDGFVRWVESSGEKGKAELRELLRQRIMEGGEVLVAIEENKIVGFAIIIDWRTLPNAKALDAMEVAKPYRGKGIGSMLTQRMIEEWGDVLIALTPSPEPGREKDLDDFYKRFGFKYITEDVMVLIPRGSDRLGKWIVILERLVNVYDSLLREIKTRVKSDEK
ncbi:MAG: GNAT family N-acetyltransferase [archaeon]|nr:GNAT family N-acetyltransferase [archaeon]